MSTQEHSQSNWQAAYRQKCSTAAEVVKHIPNNSRVGIGHAAGEPLTLVEAMVANFRQYENVETIHMFPLGGCGYMESGMEPHFRHNGLFLGGTARDAVAQGRADYTPSFFFEIPQLFRNGTLPVDVALIQVSPPDQHGYCSLGVSVDYTRSIADNAKVVMAQVNDHMPVTYGDTFIHVSQMDYIVEDSRPLVEIPLPKVGEVEKQIGAYCASLIEDGATLQLGIGALPDAVAHFLKDKNDLGLHTEMFSDGVLELLANGNINNRKKGLHEGISIANFLMGTRRLYDYVDQNPAVQLYPADYVNHPMTIAKNNRMVCINSAIQVDLMGQVVAETMGYRQFSGTGGQVDFVRGASLSPGGKSIIAFSATAAKGKVSRIVPLLDEGAAVTTSRNDVHYVITAFGIAQLKGKTLEDRARALIAIAHPDFRDQLAEAAKIRFPQFRL